MASTSGILYQASADFKPASSTSSRSTKVMPKADARIVEESEGEDTEAEHEEAERGEDEIRGNNEREQEDEDEREDWERELECGCFPLEMLGGSPLIVNDGSTARDYLARERNWLSWIKLSVTLFVISAALILRFQFGDRTIPAFEHAAEVPLGILFFVAAASALLVGIFGFFSLQSAMQRRDGFVSSGPITGALVWGIGGLTVSTCLILLAADGSEVKTKYIWSWDG